MLQPNTFPPETSKYLPSGSGKRAGADGWAPEHCEQRVASLHVTYIPLATPTFLNNSWEGEAPTHPLS